MAAGARSPRRAATPPRRPPNTAGRLSPGQAVALGALQGPAELLPVSSSGHLVLVPALLGWRYGELDAELRKSFEVALHAGTAAALLIGLRREVAEAMRELDGARIARHGLEFAPAGVVALVLERRIEERLGSPRQVAWAQIAAGLVLGLADLAPARRDEAGALDALAIGVAQAAALAPGISRNGATLTAARLLRFRRPAANRLSRHAALPIILAATGLKGFRLARRGMPREVAGPFAAGALASFASTLAATRLVRAVDEAPSYAPFAAYRVSLGFSALALLPRGGSSSV